MTTPSASRPLTSIVPIPQTSDARHGGNGGEGGSCARGNGSRVGAGPTAGRTGMDAGTTGDTTPAVTTATARGRKRVQAHLNTTTSNQAGVLEDCVRGGT